MIKIGVLGAGHLGKIHIRLILELKDDYEFIGFFDPSEKIRQEVSAQFNCKAFSDLDDLILQCDALDIVTPTLSHYECASRCMKNFKHIFIEKPVTTTTDEARNLINLMNESKVKVQVGHVERFNPAFKLAQPWFDQPMFIETHRLAQWNPRGTDVSVVLDLMIHDIDIILSVVKSNIKRISASGVAVVSETPDITNARIEFDNGCVANLTASRISLKNMRKSRFFQRDAYIGVDFLEKTAEMVQMKEVIGEPDPFAMLIDLGADKPKKQLFFEKPEVVPGNAIKEELQSFAHAIATNTDTVVTLNDGFNALDVAYKVIEKLSVATV
jgi:predicted dehydrogenase